MADNRVVLITGCSHGGIGAALAEEFASRGCKVYATARKLAKLEGVAGVEKLELDVLSDASVQAAVRTILAREGRIDILVNNAGVGCTGAILDLPLATIDETFQTNVMSALRLIQAVVPHMAVQPTKGIVVNVGSVTGLAPSPWGGTYAASKAALHAFSDVLDMELRPLGVKLVLLAPGSVKTNIGVNQTAAHVPAPPDTLYAAYRGTINRRLTLSQGPGAMPAAVFATQTVDAVLRPTPPPFMSIAPFAWSAYLLSWLPRATRHNTLWKQYGKPVPDT